MGPDTEQPDFKNPASAQSSSTDGLGVGYKVLIRNNETKEARWIEHPTPWDEHDEFMWTEGNYGCDCNRHLFFERANGVEPDDDTVQCGEAKYSALYALLPDGTQHTLDETPNVQFTGCRRQSVLMDGLGDFFNGERT